MSGRPEPTVIAQVRFTRRWQQHFAGDVAAFELGQARLLVANRVAEALPPPAGAQLATQQGASEAPAAGGRTVAATVRK